MKKGQTPHKATSSTPRDTGERLMKVDIGNLTISYKISGSGPPLVFFHGWIGNEDTFALCHAGFAKHFTVYRPAWPGYGESSRLKNFTINDFVEIARKFYQKLGLSDVTLIGNCLGGNVAMEFSRRYPTMLKRLILIELHGYFPRYFFPLLIPWANKILYRVIFKSTTGFHLLNSYLPLQEKNGDDTWRYTQEGFNRTPVESALTYIKAIYDFGKDKGMTYYETFKTEVPIIYVKGGRTFGPVAAFNDIVERHFENTIVISIPESLHNPVVEKPAIFNDRVLAALGLSK